MKIAIASDHAGFVMLELLRDYLTELGYEAVDFGPKKLDPTDDYPDYIFPAAKAVAAGECEKGVIIGGDGEGEAMAANRIKGVRCGVFYGPVMPRGVVDVKGRVSHSPYEVIRLTREHNNANMLALGARFLTAVDMKNAVKLWLETEFPGDARHQRRNNKLDRAA